MNALLRLSLLFLCLISAGCSTSYTVAVDSLCDDTSRSGINYYIEPGNDVRPDDLFFRDLVALVTPVFNARGWNVVLDKSVAHNVARLSCWQDEPRTETSYSTVTRSYTVEVGRGRHRHIEYVYYEEPVVETRTIFTVHLSIEASALEGKEKKERQIWRTALRCSTLSPNYRDVVYTMAQVLPQVMASKSGGIQYYEVEYHSDGQVEVHPLGGGPLW
jgi:hypothetical protein